jgi:type II secretory pathway pseudopilin PulG
MIKIIKKNKGYTIIEVIFYIALFALLSTVVIDSLLKMSKSFIEVSAQSELLQSSSIMERISREIRGASSFTLVSATDLILKDSIKTNKTEFKLSGTNLQLLEGSGLSFTGNLNDANISITNLSFTSISMTKGYAIKVVLTVRYDRGTTSRTEKFYDTVVLRGSYI